MGEVLDGLKHDNHHDGRTVGVGNHVAGTVEGVLCVAFRNNQRYIVVHTEGRRVVDHHSTVLGDVLLEFLAGACASRCKHEIHALEVVGIVLEFLDNNVLAAEVIGTAGTTGRAEENQFIEREVTLVQDFEELLTYGAACTHYSYFHFFLNFLFY